MKNLKCLGAVFAAVFVLSLGVVSCSNPANDTSPPPVLPGTIAISPAENVTVGTPLSAVYSESETGISYQWNKDGKPIDGATETAYTPTDAGSYTVTVNKAGYTGITSAAVTVIDGASFTGTIAITPAENVTVGTTLTAVYSGGSETDLRYQWNMDGTVIPEATAETHTPASAGTYTVTVNKEGYTGITSAAVTVTLSELSGDITISGQANTGETLTAVYSGSEDGLTYQWNKDGTAIPGAVNKTYTPLSGGSYTVTLSKTGYNSITSAAVTVIDGVSVNYDTLADDLAAITGDSANAPIRIILAAITISTATPAPAESTGWGDIYAILDAAQKYVVLGLSECSFTDSAVTGNNPPTGNDMNIIGDNEHIKGVILPESVTSIGDSAFANCTGLTSVAISGSVTSIGEGAFYCCTALTGLAIPGSVTSIAGHAFEDCTALTGVTISEGVTSIGNGAFSRCSALESITIPKSVTTIETNAFLGCDNLVSVTFERSSGLTIDANAFPGSSDADNLLKNAYEADGAGTYTRTKGANDWAKQQ